MLKDKKTPEIRFKGFTEDWEQRKWIDMVNISTEMVDPKSGKYDNLPHIGPGNIESFTGQFYDNIKKVGEENLISGKFHFYPEDIIYGKINPQLGKYVFPLFEGLSSADSYVLNAKNGLNQKYLYTLLQTTDFYKYSVSVSMRSGMPKINRDELNAYEFSMPKGNEQQQIGALFLEIDNLITLHQRKCDKLLNFKKSMLEKMFPKNSSNFPEIRFKGFTDAWEQRKLEEICNRFDNLRVPVAANQREKGNIPYYGANGIQDYVKGFTHKGEFILIAEDGANDLKNYPVNYVNGLFWANNHVHVLQSKEKIGNNKFLKFCISRTNIEHLLVGGGRAKLNSNIMMNMDLKIPAIVEQEKIGNILFEIDNLITLHQRKLEKLKNIKTSMLNKMFI